MINRWIAESTTLIRNISHCTIKTHLMKAQLIQTHLNSNAWYKFKLITTHTLAADSSIAQTLRWLRVNSGTPIPRTLIVRGMGCSTSQIVGKNFCLLAWFRFSALHFVHIYSITSQLKSLLLHAHSNALYKSKMMQMIVRFIIQLAFVAELSEVGVHKCTPYYAVYYAVCTVDASRLRRRGAP